MQGGSGNTCSSGGKSGGCGCVRDVNNNKVNIVRDCGISIRSHNFSAKGQAELMKLLLIVMTDTFCTSMYRFIVFTVMAPRGAGLNKG